MLKKAFVKNTNLNCDLKTTDYKSFEKLSHDFIFSPYQINFLKTQNMTDIIHSNIKEKNYLMFNNEYGFEILFYENL
jgi:hypothetical protein